jgi:hypothetical protein
MTRLTRYIESRGFWFFIGAVVLFLYLSRQYRVVKRQPKPADNVLQYEKASA